MKHENISVGVALLPQFRGQGLPHKTRREYIRVGSGAALALLTWIWPGLIQAQVLNQTARKPFSALAPDPLQSLHVSNYLIGIVIVFAALAVASWLLRRYQPGVGRGLIRVQACLSLGAKERLMVIEVEGQRMLIGVGNAGIRQLQVLDPRVEGTPIGDHDERSIQPGSAAGGWLQKTLKTGMGT